MDTSKRGSITLESAISCLVIIIILMLIIEIIGFAKANLQMIEDLEERLSQVSLIHHQENIYLIDVISPIKAKNVDKVIFTAIPDKKLFHMGAFGRYRGIIKDIGISANSISGKWDGDDKPVPEVNIWALEPFERGRAIHQMMGANLDPNFPLLDIYDEYLGHAKTIISINTQDKSYLSGSDFAKRIKEKIIALRDFEGIEYMGLVINKGDIKKKSLILVIPNLELTPFQTRQLEEMKRFAFISQVDLVIKKFQG